MWHMKAHSQCLSCPGKLSSLRKIPVGMLHKPSSAPLSLPDPLSCPCAWQLPSWRLGGEEATNCTSPVPCIYVQKSSFSSSLGTSLPHCPVSCCLLWAPPGQFPLRWCFVGLGHLWKKSCGGHRAPYRKRSLPVRLA